MNSPVLPRQNFALYGGKTIYVLLKSLGYHCYYVSLRNVNNNELAPQVCISCTVSGVQGGILHHASSCI